MTNKDKLSIGILIILILVAFALLYNPANASSVNPNGQCGEGPVGVVLYDDHYRVVGELGGYPYVVDVCKYYNVGGLTLTPAEFCYLPEVINGWYAIWKHKLNEAGDYICWIDVMRENHHTNTQTQEAKFRKHN